MRADCAPRCANFPQNPIFSPKTHKTAIFDNTPRQTPLENPAPHDAPAPKPHQKHLPLIFLCNFYRTPQNQKEFYFPLPLRIKWLYV
jgi:hypothetical protein